MVGAPDTGLFVLLAQLNRSRSKIHLANLGQEGREAGGSCEGRGRKRKAEVRDTKERREGGK